MSAQSNERQSDGQHRCQCGRDPCDCGGRSPECFGCSECRDDRIEAEDAECALPASKNNSKTSTR